MRVREQPIRVIDREADRLPDECYRWFGLAPLGAFGGGMGMFGPRIDMVEYDDRFKVTVDVPGMKRDDIDVTLSGERLTVRGRTRDRQERRDRSTYRLVRSQRAFRRSVLMPCPIDADQAAASLRRGVLTVTLPKADSGRSGTRIPVTSGSDGRR